MRKPVYHLVRTLTAWALAATSAFAQFKPDFQLKPDDFAVLMDGESTITLRITVASLRAPSGSTLGSFRWIAWETSPASSTAENTAWQEFHVETAR